jgi:primosomal protein N' (replication factor Y) (superfamily II helicase)
LYEEAASRAFEAREAASIAGATAGEASAVPGPVGEAASAGRRALVARVLPDVAGFERELDYEVPSALADEVRVGTVVRVPLQGRRVRGWVLSYPVAPIEGLALRPVAKVTGWGPPPELVDLASWAAWRWAGRRRSLLVTASPETAVRRLPVAALPAAAPLSQVSSPGGPPSGGPVTAAASVTDRTASAHLVHEAWRPGVHLLRLPPVYGATEVVLAAAERGRVLVVVPTTARAAAGCAALRKRGLRVALLPEDWAQARAGADVVIGTRAAAWGPCPGVGAFVVLDAHDEGLVQETAPTWDASSVSAERARREGVPCFWVTPCPSLELVAGADDVHTASRASERSGWAALQLVDRRRDDPRLGLYSSPLVEVLKGGQRVVCVLNRKGRASLSICGACGEAATCERCGAGVALVGEQFQCPRCGLSRPVVCASCGSDTLRQFRVGVTRAREQLEALAGRPVGEVVGGTQELPDTPVLVGTEAVLYRDGELRRRGPVAAVAFLDFDQELLAPRYRAADEALALLSRASRIVGGRQHGGKVIVQTRVPGHPVIEAALLADPGRLLAVEEPVRKALRLPPFMAMALVSGPGAPELAAILEEQGAGVEVNQLAEDRWVVRAPDGAALADALGAAGRPTGRVRVEVGPLRI